MIAQCHVVRRKRRFTAVTHYAYFMRTRGRFWCPRKMRTKGPSPRPHARLKLPIVGGKWIRKIPNRAQLQDKDYEPYQKVNAEYWKLKKAEEKNGKPLGFLSKSKVKEYQRLHQAELNTYRVYRDMLKDRIREPEKKIEPKKWEKELAAFKTELDGLWKEYSDTVWELAIIETLEHNKKDLDRMLGNENH